jgi:hypothetical protein
MAQQSISHSDQKCISECIVKHWSESSPLPPEQRPEAYEACLTSCRICG